MRMHDENIARKSYSGSLCRLQEIEARMVVLNQTLGQYNAAARDDLLGGRSAGVFGQYARVTSDIRKELTRLEDEKRMQDRALLQSEGVLLGAHRARKSADQYHRRLVRMIALKRTAEADKQVALTRQPGESLEFPDVY